VKIYIPDEFVGLILIPIIGNVAEYLIVVTGTFWNKIDLIIGIAFESDIQITVFLLPVIILVSWIIDITNIILILDDFPYYSLFVSLLILFPTLLAADIYKLENNLRADNKLRIIDRFSDISLLFLYSVIAIIVFFFIYLIWLR
jgi:calcium/proton exchanger cax